MALTSRRQSRVKALVQAAYPSEPGFSPLESTASTMIHFDFALDFARLFGRYEPNTLADARHVSPALSPETFR